MLKRTYFMAVIDNEFCLRMSAVCKPKACLFHPVWVEWNTST